MRSLRVERLRARLLCLVGLAVVPPLAMILYDGLRERREARDDAHREAQELARRAARSGQRLVTDGAQTLAFLAHLPQIREDPEACSAFVRAFLESTPYAYLAVARTNGEIVCSSLPVAPGVSPLGRPWFDQILRTGDFTIGDYQIGRLTGLPSLIFAYPIVDADSLFRSIVFATLPLTWLQNEIADAELPPGSTVMVLDRNHVVLARFPPDPSLIGKQVADSAVADAIRGHGKEVTIEATGFDGVRRLYVIEPLTNQPNMEPITLVVGIPAEVAYAPVRRELVRNLIALAILTLVVMGTAWWGSDAFVLRHVAALLGATRRLGAGDLDTRVPVSNQGGELAELGASFNEMAADLETRALEAREHMVRIARLNRVYAVLSGINSALLRTRDADALLREACRVAIEEGEFRLAVAQRVDPGRRDLRTVAAAGAAIAGADREATPAGEADARTLAEAVVRDNRHFVVNDLEQSKANGRYGSAAAFPLRVGDKTEGVLSLFAAESGFFDGEEIRLLQELASDVSLGLSLAAQGQRLERVANYDLLTNLPNRNLFGERLDQALAAASRSNRKVAVVSGRLNRIAEINAALGHHTGDRVLREMARYLEKAVPEGSVVARIGSSEFGIVLTVEDPDSLQVILDDLLEEAPRKVPVDGVQFVSLALGVALHPRDARDGPTLIRDATLARQSGGSRITNSLTFYSDHMNTRAQEKRTLEHALRTAIEEGQFQLVYQPVVDVRRREMLGVEALLRWNSPQLGEVTPDKFIPVAEKAGLIGQIGEWTLANACEQGQRWHRAGHKLYVNVNVSVAQFREKDSTSHFQQVLEKTGFDPHFLSLGLEITESELMSNVEAMIGILSRYRQMGISIYIDDFGTGYSSLSYLRELPIDTLKIDTSFIRDIPGDEDAVAVVKAVVAMAHSLEMTTIAEGVETAEQFNALHSIGCDAVQGYVFSRPLPPESIEPFFGKQFELNA